MKPRPVGRPSLGKSETTQYNIKLPVADLARWRRAAERAGLTLSAWIRERCNK
jgi:hypothetical protein